MDHVTTLELCQQMLLNNQWFNDDGELLAKDDEETLVVFQDHIRWVTCTCFCTCTCTQGFPLSSKFATASRFAKSAETGAESHSKI